MDIPPIFEKPKRKKRVTISPLMSMVLLAPVVLFVFGSGIYIGMSLVGSDRSHAEPAVEVAPGDRYAKGGPGNLRGATIAAQPAAVPAPVPVPEPLHATPDMAQRDRTAGTSKDAASREEHQLPPRAPEQNSIKQLRSNIFLKDHGLESQLAQSLYVDGVAHFTATTSMDSDHLIIGAWIRLDQLALDTTMRTVFSNKRPGCDRDESRNGVSMYVNEWETGNQILYVEYGSAVTGCEKVTSGSVQMLPGVWYHVAVSFIKGSVELYVDGAGVGRRDGSAHEVQSARPMQVGHYDSDGSFALFGNVSHFAVAHCEKADAINVQNIVRTMMDPSTVESTPYLFSLFKFKEAAWENPGVHAVDVMKHTGGSYVFPRRGKTVSGIKFSLRDEAPSFEESDLIDSDHLARERRQSIKDGMIHSWTGYKAYAWGRDELKPGSRKGGDPWGGIGCTLVDALDTLWVMDMKTEFYEAVDWVRNSLSFDHAGTVSTFETTIRELGGLLSAYDLSGEKILLQKAEDLGDRLARAFNTRSGIPTGQVSLSAGGGSPTHQGGSAVLSELGTLQVEFRYLAEATKRKEFETKAMKAFQVMKTKTPSHGLYPIKVSLSDGSFVDRHVTFGALGDSFYEYLLKVWIQGGKRETWLREMYDEAINGVMDVLLKTTKKTGLAYISDWDGRNNIHKMDHLVCFMPGILALGSVTDPNGKESPRAQRDMAVAKALMFTCREMYHSTATGVAPEFVTFDGGNDMNTKTSAPFYILRPETAESLFVLHQITKNPIYREWAWEIWTAIDQHCKKGAGYGALQNVNSPNSGTDDRMESFFLAETLKYLYLVQDPDNTIDLSKYVFNTEAHPMRILSDSHEPVPPQ